MKQLTETTSASIQCEPFDLEDAPVRELPQIFPLFWFHLAEGPKREALRMKQEKEAIRIFKSLGLSGVF